MPDSRPQYVAKASPLAITTSVSMVLTAVLVFLMAILPAPYLVQMPGPAMDVLGTFEDEDETTDEEPDWMIQISGAEVYESEGQLLLTTVSGMGSPGHRAGVLNVLRGWWSGQETVHPIEYFYPRDLSPEQADESGLNQMLGSQDQATIAALEFLGYIVTTRVEVAEVEDDSPNVGILEPEDTLLSINGAEIDRIDALSDIMEGITAGDTMNVRVRRGGETLDLDVATIGAEGQALMRILVWEHAEFPIDVQFNLNNVGGPSAGLMFALGIIDLLSPDGGPGDNVIAGTGTIDADGAVGPIGGIRQKLHGARNAGATWFLSPEDNCGETIGYVPDGLTVLKVSTLAEAQSAVDGIGQGKTDHLARCS